MGKLTYRYTRQALYDLVWPETRTHLAERLGLSDGGISNAIETAMRLREMYTLSYSQVSTKDRTIYLDKTKNGDKRQVPLSSVALVALENYGLRKKGHLFPWWDGDANSEVLKKTTGRLSRQFARIFDAAGCQDMRFHDLRHEATSRLYERTDLSDLEIAKITGHKDPKMLMRYANLRGSNLAGRLW